MTSCFSAINSRTCKRKVQNLLFKVRKQNVCVGVRLRALDCSKVDCEGRPAHIAAVAVFTEGHIYQTVRSGLCLSVSHVPELQCIDERLAFL